MNALLSSTKRVFTISLNLMPAYIWKCLACGQTNQSSAISCIDCACPASASFKQISAYRERHLARGGQILAGAGMLTEEDDYEFLEILAGLLLKTLDAIYSFPKFK